MATTTRRRKPRVRITQTVFDFEKRPAFPPANRTRTSIAAAEAIADNAPTLRGRVFAFVAGQGQAGATREEIAAALDMPLQTVCGRVNELIAQCLVHRTDETRPTASGRAAGVVRAHGARAESMRRCRVCGCTNSDACWDYEAGTPCSWVEADLCSACVGRERTLSRPREADLSHGER
jgi:hypothetical protein